MPVGDDVTGHLGAALHADHWHGRGAGLVNAIATVWERQQAVGLPVAPQPVEQFWERPYRTLPAAATDRLREAITDRRVRAV